MADESEATTDWRRVARAWLEDQQRAGVSHLPLPRPQSADRFTGATGAAAPLSLDENYSGAGMSPRKEGASSKTMRRGAGSAVPTAAPAASTAPARSIISDTPFPPRGTAVDTRAKLEVIRQEVAGCRRCRELAETRTQTVFGVGNVAPRLCFLGEAPGADEDAQGEPFVGRAGQLLNRIIEACTLRREDVYILNVIKCRPPGNRTPSPEEAGNCREYLQRQLELLQPEFICCLGLVAAQNLLGTELSLGKLRGRFFDFRGAQVICTYHPAYLLRNPPAKRQVREDMQLLMAKMGIELPTAGKE